MNPLRLWRAARDMRRSSPGPHRVRAHDAARRIVTEARRVCRHTRRAGAAAVLAALAGCTALPGGGYRVGGGSGPGCALSRVAIVPVTAYDGLLFVTAHVDGKPVRLVLDTGAQRSLLTEATVRRLGLPADRDHGTRTWGIGGPTTSFDAVVRRFTLAGVAFTMPRITVGRFRLAALRGGADGMLGADVLTLFGIDLDAAAGRMVLYRDPACRLSRPPWDGPAVDLPGVQAGGNRLRLPIAVNGTQGMATLDTGAQTTAIGLGLALRAGVTPSALAADRYALARGAAPAAVHVRLQQFRSLQVGPWLARDPVLPIIPLPAGVGDGLVGEDFLLHRRVWLSFAAPQVFVAVAGAKTPLASR
ncbi:MAG TPA: retropepsin-like aspartic protease [Acetobacteraceae bacterium]|nr:retropepsin-like aspartic protease [Acetobacteraceae bacterium]